LNSKYYRLKALDFEVNRLPGIIVEDKQKAVSFNTEISELSLEGGAQLNLKDYPERKSIIYFYATWCKPCVKTLVAYNEASCEHDFNFFPIALESSLNSLKKLFKKKDFKFDILIGAESLKQQMGIKKFPTALLVSANGMIESEMTSLEISTFIASKICDK